MKTWYGPEFQSEAGTAGLRLSEPEAGDGEKSAWQVWCFNGMVSVGGQGCGGVRSFCCNNGVEGAAGA